MMSATVVKGPPRPPAGRGAMSRFRADPRRLALHLGGIAALAFVLVSSDAFGSDDLSLGRRVLMFGTISTLLVAQASLLADATRRLRLSSLFGSAWAAAAALAATLLLMTVEIDALKATPIVPYAPDPLPEFALFLMPFVLPVAGLVVGLKWAARRDAAPDHARSPVATHDAVARVAVPEPPPVPEPDRDAWPAAPVRRIQAVDHYLHLWTPRGTVLIRGRLRDAVGRLPADAGIRPHRSWWVAWSEVDRLERRGRDHVLRLGNGDRVPVARARVAEVRRALAGRAGSD